MPRVTGILGSDEALLFDFFRMRTTVSTNAFLGSKFWSCLVFQLSHIEPAFKHAVLGLSALHRRAESDLNDYASERWHRQALVQYGSAINETQKLIQRVCSNNRSNEGTVVLAVCLILSIFDSLVGNYKGAQTHLQTGRRIAVERSKQPGSILPLMNTVEKEVKNLLERLDLQAMVFEERHAPYPYQTSPMVHDVNTPLPSTFPDFSEAHQYLIRILHALVRLGFFFADESYASIRPYIHEVHALCSARLAQWQTAFSDLLSRAGETLVFEHGLTPGRVLYLKAHHCLAKIIIGAGFSGSETRWDCFISDFRRIIDLCERIIRSDCGTPCSTDYQMEQGLLMPLFMVASRCRDPVLRRRAIALMSSAKRIEGCWDSRGVAVLSQRMLEFEEGSVGPEGIVTCAADIPLEARVLSIDPKMDLEERRLDVIFGKMSADGTWHQIQETVLKVEPSGS